MFVFESFIKCVENNAKTDLFPNLDTLIFQLVWIKEVLLYLYLSDISILERLMNTNELYQTHNSNFITMLRLNFRAHPDVLKIPNELFYEGKLKVSNHSRKYWHKILLNVFCCRLCPVMHLKIPFQKSLFTQRFLNNRRQKLMIWKVHL